MENKQKQKQQQERKKRRRTQNQICIISCGQVLEESVGFRSVVWTKW